METEAAQSLIQRALQTESQSTAYLLIDAAARLDDTINSQTIKKEWINQWMQREYKKMLEQQKLTPHNKP